MSKFEIEGPNTLEGEIEVYGAKNAAMKMIAACVLISGKVTLQNVPDILDIQTIINILVENGASIQRNGHTLEIDTTNLSEKDPDPQLVKKMRGSIVLVGPYLARFKKISIPQPGGCTIGSRPIDIHIDGFRQLGVNITENDCLFEFQTDELKGNEIHLKGISVTATENVLMAASLTNGKTTISNVAKEPEVVDLINFLNNAGAKISGIGTDTIVIDGVRKLNPINYTVIPDRIEAGTFVALAIATKSLLKITKCRTQDLEAFLSIINKMGVDFEKGEDYILVKNSNNLKEVNIETQVHPGFPTDLQAPMGLLFTQAEGQSTINEKIHENRLEYLKELKDMGANVEIVNPKTAKITGPTILRGKTVDSLDLRAGATLILAGLIANGKTVINKAEIVDRGYEKIEERLQRIGAKIKRIQ